MNKELYETLTGTQIPPAKAGRVNAVINRVNAIAEGLLGYSPTGPSTFTELGKSNGLPIDLDNLLPADEDESGDGTYISIPYRYADIFFMVAPATAIHAVKFGVPTSSDEFVTVGEMRNFYLKSNGKMITAVEKPLGIYWSDVVQTYFANPDMNVQLFIQGTWLAGDALPLDLQYALVDMVDYYRAPQTSVIGNVKSESISGHSYTRSEAKAPESTTSASVFTKYSIKNMNPVIQ